jgi:2-haloacid dehalogenase
LQALAPTTSAAQNRAVISSKTAGNTSTRALFFDVFGTLVDWRSGVAREAERILKPLGTSLDWAAFADAWRGEYQPGMEEVRAGRLPFCKSTYCGATLNLSLPAEIIRHVLAGALAWHRLDAWPEVPAALACLKGKFLLAPVSNGNISLMVDLARRNHFPWDAILGAEVAGDYKPKARVYTAACAAFDLKPEHCMMVAAHSSDLAAAAACGLRTGHIARPHEHGPVTGELAPTVAVDVAGAD